MKILVIAPLHDYPTILSNQAVSHLCMWMDNAGVNYDILRSIAANRLSINFLAKLKQYNGIFYYGHGQEDRLGDWLMFLIPLIDKRNIHLFKNTIFYTMACLSGVELSKEAIKKGVTSYYGHNVRYFAFVDKIGHNYSFLQDWIELVTFIPKRLILGDSTGLALNKYEHFANSLYSRYLHLDRHINLKLLYQNALHLNLYGNREAKLK